MTKQISITIEEDQLTYLDELAEINSRFRSGMISYLIKQSMDQDKALDEEAEYYGKVIWVDAENLEVIDYD